MKNSILQVLVISISLVSVLGISNLGWSGPISQKEGATANSDSDPVYIVPVDD